LIQHNCRKELARGARYSGAAALSIQKKREMQASLGKAGAAFLPEKAIM
jgi:hypothetical protein